MSYVPTYSSLLVIKMSIVVAVNSLEDFNIHKHRLMFGKQEKKNHMFITDRVLGLKLGGAPPQAVRSLLNK